MNKHEEILYSLFELAKRNENFNRYRLASALIIKGKEPILGFNRMKTHPLQKKFCSNDERVFLHAEIDAIKIAIQRFGIDAIQGSTLYVARAKRDFKKRWMWGLSEPCDGCKKAIMAFGIKMVYYTLDEENYKKEYSNLEYFEK